MDTNRTALLRRVVRLGLGGFDWQCHGLAVHLGEADLQQASLDGHALLTGLLAALVGEQLGVDVADPETDDDGLLPVDLRSSAWRRCVLASPPVTRRSNLVYSTSLGSPRMAEMEQARKGWPLRGFTSRMRLR
jgi:hypothetical protein